MSFLHDKSCAYRILRCVLMRRHVYLHDKPCVYYTIMFDMTLYHICTINLARTTVTAHCASLAWAWNKRIRWNATQTHSKQFLWFCVTNELPRLFHPQRTQITGIRSEAQSTIIIIMKCVVLICTISLARAILMFGIRRDVYLHDKSCRAILVLMFEMRRGVYLHDKSCTISLARAILMFGIRRDVYLHDKSCACYANVWNTSWWR